ncbi:DUF1330 domain-containing protein [Auraticoccus sp. F435]|uniref:DUF1330 domain-containing protein n=1 Tax=Auraticoccus cholistanensis TaxID=2656650 RepID=A0A6A9V1M8_9ACTN|nr:DUF1330 domain-containing protein [Auraticoccus cholistanensis]MVA77487.1 DUF1330 domain-containing protein [Auraticoccus cholistanensis]
MAEETPGLTLTVLLWAVPGREDELARYEDAVLALLPRYGGRVRERVRRREADPDQPLEVQVIDLPDTDALEGFLVDPERVSMTAVRDRCVARTQMFEVTRAAAG